MKLGSVELMRISPYQFTWSLWSGGSIKTLGVQSRFLDIVSPRGKTVLRKHAVGYCRGESLICRARHGEIAVMCFCDGEHFWFHLRKNEFEEVFGIET